jgi:hypothetical protein
MNESYLLIVGGIIFEITIGRLLRRFQSRYEMDKPGRSDGSELLKWFLSGLLLHFAKGMER